MIIKKKKKKEEERKEAERLAKIKECKHEFIVERTCTRATKVWFIYLCLTSSFLPFCIADFHIRKYVCNKCKVCKDDLVKN